RRQAVVVKQPIGGRGAVRVSEDHIAEQTRRVEMNRDVFSDVERGEVGGRRDAARNLILLPVGRIAPRPAGLRRNPDAAPQSAYGESRAGCESGADDVARNVHYPRAARSQV